jgi:hypothetical protein
MTAKPSVFCLARVLPSRLVLRRSRESVSFDEFRLHLSSNKVCNWTVEQFAGLQRGAMLVKRNMSFFVSRQFFGTSSSNSPC